MLSCYLIPSVGKDMKYKLVFSHHLFHHLFSFFKIWLLAAWACCPPPFDIVNVQQRFRPIRRKNQSKCRFFPVIFPFQTYQKQLVENSKTQFIQVFALSRSNPKAFHHPNLCVPKGMSMHDAHYKFPATTLSDDSGQSHLNIYGEINVFYLRASSPTLWVSPLG